MPSFSDQNIEGPDGGCSRHDLETDLRFRQATMDGTGRKPLLLTGAEQDDVGFKRQQMFEMGGLQVAHVRHVPCVHPGGGQQHAVRIHLFADLKPARPVALDLMSRRACK